MATGVWFIADDVKHTLSMMIQERHKGLLLMSIHYDMDVDCQAVVDSFSRRYPRKMKLTNILNSDD